MSTSGRMYTPHRANAPERRRAPVHVWSELGATGAGRGAERGDVVVIVDALRASATIAVALRLGARAVLPVLTVDQAEAYLADPHYRVAGERGGARLPTFHYGNSPSELLAGAEDLVGRILVLTTSNGTRCVEAALRGASAAQRQGCDVTLVAAGLEDRPASEDTYAVALIAGRLADLGALLAAPSPRVGESDSLSVFSTSRSAARLTELGYAEDVRLCARVDVWETVPVYLAEARDRAGSPDPAGSRDLVGFVEV